MPYVNPMDAAQRTSFPSGSGTCTAWVTAPETPPPWPVVVLAHGLGATRPMALPVYEQAFSAAGIAAVSFDYRHLGESAGTPRQLISVQRQVEDLEAGVAFARSLDAVDGERVALWGTSLGAAHVFTVAARDPRLAAAVVQCPIVDGLDAGRRLGVRAALRMSLPIARDLGRRISGRDRITVKLVGEPGEQALVTAPGAAAGWSSVMPDGYEFDNRVTPAVALEMLHYRPARRAGRITCPLLVLVSRRETLMNPRIARTAALSAPRGEFIDVDTDHFGVYHEPHLSGLREIEAQFLRRHLTGVPTEICAS